MLISNSPYWNLSQVTAWVIFRDQKTVQLFSPPNEDGWARTWVRDFGHPASPMVIALFNSEHPAHDTVKHHAKEIVDVAKAGYK